MPNVLFGKKKGAKVKKNLSLPPADNQPSSIHSISLSPLGLCLLSISIPSEPARTRKGRHQPLIEHQFTGIRPFPISQLQASFEEFYNLRNILLWNVSARGELAFKGFLRYHPCKYSYEKTIRLH